MQGNLFKVLLFTAVTFTAAVSHAQISIKLRLSEPAPVERPAPPSTHHVWVDGEWVWAHNNYVWHPGHWVLPKPYMVWVKGYWQQQPGGTWRWISGHWDEIDHGVAIKVRPQAPVETRPAAPSAAHVWVEGEWIWRNHNYTWQPGHWIVPPVSSIWVKGYWMERPDGQWYWVAGHWKEVVR